ncbi:MAG: hypothetical protein JWN34_508 [Bryobacterales bacterium]|nr:hypothetical protein [Bryobacterales bacterium]
MKRMPRLCSICIHEQRLPIEKAMIAGASLRDVAGLYGTCKSNLDRHRPHITRALSKHAEVQELARTTTLLQDVRRGEARAERLYAQTEAILAGAVASDDPRVALLAVRAVVAVMAEARSFMSLRGEITNELGRDRTAPTISVQIIAPQTFNELPRVSFWQEDACEAGYEEIGLIQR